MAAGVDDLRLDGNAAGGMLGEVFAFEVTTARATCAGCGRDGPVGELLVYASAMGTILRCPTCDDPLIRVAHVRGGHWLDLRGLRTLRVEPPA
jgi:Family of unknown function (DUF6510)